MEETDLLTGDMEEQTYLLVIWRNRLTGDMEETDLLTGDMEEQTYW